MLWQHGCEYNEWEYLGDHTKASTNLLHTMWLNADMHRKKKYQSRLEKDQC